MLLRLRITNRPAYARPVVPPKKRLSQSKYQLLKVVIMGWEEVAADKRKRIEESIPKEWRVEVKDQNGSFMDLPASSGLLTADELEITNSSGVDLVSKLAAGQLKSVDVTLAFCKRAALAHQAVSKEISQSVSWFRSTSTDDDEQLNLALEFFPDMALAQAKELDKYYEENKKPVGPLHGLPISLKDQLRVKGLETSMGYVAWLGKFDEEDSALTALLRKAGAVFYIKTSVPQSLMVCETVNNIIGRTLNPRNKNWSCGGSSGGEGANIGFRGGIIGVGTDIGECQDTNR